MNDTPWAIGPFTRPIRILDDRPRVEFDCPVAQTRIAWAEANLFNPAAVVQDGRVCLLVRAEDAAGRYAGTSRIGLATSTDGINFELAPEPVIAPGDDPWQAWEWPGGCEDPRAVEAPDGSFVCTYTAFDGKVGCLFVATSPDLARWTKHGPAFAGTQWVRRPTKSGAIVTELKDGRLVAARIDGKYWMYWGEGVTYAAMSEDLVRWTPVEIETAPDRYLGWSSPREGAPAGWSVNFVPGPTALRPLAGPRRRRFDSGLTEPGPPAVLTDAGIVLIYNGGNARRDGDPRFPPRAYQPGQLLFDAAEPTAVIGRTEDPFLTIDPAEAQGQVGNVAFAEGLVAFRGEWRLYLGLADSRIGVSTAPIR
jgi:predicted GH43/DUF377 family glycosyl hydrolase